MKRSSSRGGLIKKTAAVMLSMVMAFGAVSALPNSFITDHAVVASAEANVAVNDCIFYYTFTERTGTKTITITNVTIMNDEGIVDIPSTIEVNGITYPVTAIGDSFLARNTEVKDVIIPDTVTYFQSYVLLGSSVENITLSNNLDTIDQGFAYYCQNLKSVKYSGTKLIGSKLVTPFQGANVNNLLNEKGAFCLGNWLIKYKDDSASSVKIADLGNDGIKIDSIANSAIDAKNLISIDLDGVWYIGSRNLADHENLTVVKNDDSVREIGADVLKSTPWFNIGKKDGLLKLGNALIYYRTDGDTIDLTSEELSDIVIVGKDAFMDCRNAVTFKCNSDCKLVDGCFYKSYDGNNLPQRDPLPLISTYKIENIYLDGKKLEFSKEDPEMPEWTTKNYSALEETEWVKVNVEAKAKALFEQLDMTYYGSDNDKVGTLSKTEEFYNALKIHDYISTYDPDSNREYYNGVNAFMAGGKLTCGGYADVSFYLLDCSGVDYMAMCSNTHEWIELKIGDEWFETDFGWDEQLGNHYYYWFCRSDTSFSRDEGSAHRWKYAADSWHLRSEEHNTVPEPAKRFLGDINGDDARDEKDLVMLWDYIKGNIKLKDDKAIAADINFDGVIDITDGVLLENFVHGTAVDPNDFPTDGLAPGFKAVFVEPCDPEDIDPNEFIYQTTDRDGYLVLPEVMYDVPEGKKFGGWDYGQEGKPGKAGQKVKIKNPYTVIQPVWKNESDPDDDDSNTDTEDKWLLGDVDGSGTIDISDVSKLMNHINGVKALDEDEFLRADVNGSKSVEISDASAIVNHINGVKAIEGTV